MRIIIKCALITEQPIFTFKHYDIFDTSEKHAILCREITFFPWNFLDVTYTSRKKSMREQARTKDEINLLTVADRGGRSTRST